VIGMIAVLVVLLIGLGVGLARPDLLRLSASPLFAAGGKAAPGAGGGAGSADVTPAAGSTGTGEAGPTDPTAELRRLAQSDAASLGAIADTWVPQLASKRPGTVAAGRTWDAAAILAEHQQLRARYPQARLLWSGDWSVFGGDDYWVTVLASPVASPAGADGWCDGQGLGADDCFATWLSHRGGSAGTAVHR
jgi:hypothetical protein